MQPTANKTTITDLEPTYSSVQSFYGKARVHTVELGEETVYALYSYNSLIAEVDSKGNVVLTSKWDYSNTTMRHLHEFLKQYAEDFSTKEIRRQVKCGYRKSMVIDHAKMGAWTGDFLKEGQDE
jgi:hypothetical protein